ncbi:VCBS domain-containing protein [Bradyrhizobium diazoefficiens]|nr:VCBS domain-containing protein [Bradyrhizobium diazoefficiens]QQN64690.1 VCBS domain-containing protein [Bradyrhizobium diazoefficiens]
MATQTTGGGSTTSFSNTPQATNDIFTSGVTAAGLSISLTEDNLQPVFFDVMGNDLGGNAKTLFSIDNGINDSGAMSGYSAADLLTQDTARIEATSSDTSLNGAKIWITADGKVGYDASALSAQIATLSAGEFFIDSFIYAIRLGNGTLSWATATVKIAGYNDGPVAVADTNAVKEDTGPNPVSGNVLTNDTDVDAHDSHSVTAVNGSAAQVGVDVVGTYGTLHLNADGTYTYTLNNAQANVQALAAGQQVYDTFSYTNSDNHGGSNDANLTITVTGSNDAPVITSAAQNGLATEWADLSAAEGSNTPHTASGAVTFTDVDTLDSHTASFAPQGGGYLGSFTLNTTNHDTGNGGSIGWSFSVADGAIDYLQAGQTLTQKYDVTISDGHGGTTVQTVTVTIVGTNDAPAITSSAQSGLATEWADLSAAEGSNTPHTASGAVTFTDVDTLDSHTASFAPQGGGYLGSFTLNTTNHDTGNGGSIGWSFSVADGAIDYLQAGQTLTQKYDVTISDGHGGTTVQTVTVTIVGTNDAPVITSAAQSGNVAEGDDLPAAARTATGQVTFTDVDASDSHTLSLSVAAAHGSATVDPDGTWHYTVLDSGAVDALAAGEHLADSFTVEVDDHHGGLATQLVAIDITGTNDAPVITSAAQSGNVAEGDDLPAAARTATGQVTFTDVDASDSHTLSLSVAAAHGSASVDPDGTWHYTVLDSGAVDALAAGEHLADSFTVEVDDHHGGLATQLVAIDITGTNDAPVITSAAQSGNVAEGDDLPAAARTATGQVTFTDVDASDSHTLSLSVAAAHGSASVDPDGTWHYTVLDSGAVDALAAGEHLADSFTVEVDDHHGGLATQLVAIDITGTNDAPVITSAAQSGNVAEGDDLPAAARTATGQVTFTDVDASDSHTLSLSVAAAHGSASVDPDGTWHYTVLDSGAVDALAAGEHLADSFTVEVDDHHGGLATQLVAIDITGTNDAPVITSAAQSGNVAEGDDLPAAARTATGQVTFTDVDASDSHTLSLSVAAAHGSASVDPDGTWHYTVLDSGAVDALAAGEHLADSFTVEVDDHHGGLATQLVAIDITGTNDAPVITSAAQSGNVAEGDDLPAAARTATGQVTFTDVDASDSHTLSLSVAAAHGSASVDPDGTWHYTVLDSGAVDALAAGEHLADSFTVEVDDHHGGLATQLVSIDITGTNDAPLAVTDTNSGLEDATITGTVATNDSDVDDGATLTYAQTSAVAGLTINPDGSYSLDASNAAYQHLAQGATTDVVANYTVTDEHGASASSTLTITLTGTNDAPVAVADTNSGLEDATITGTVATNDSDVDDGASLSYSLDAQVAGLTLNPDGSYSLDAGNAAYQHLAQGATTDMVASYTVTDEHGATASSILTITLTGSNDAPVAVADTNSGLEDSTITGTVATNDSDVDDGATLSYSLDAPVAGLTLNPDGSYSLDAGNAAYQHLAQGATTDVVANYTVTDEHGATASSILTITLTGSNDAPVAVADTNSGLEDATITGTVATNDSDVDDGASLSYSLDAQVAGLTLNPDGSYSLDASNAAYQHLAQDATTDVVASYTVTDEHGATASSILTITLTGSNDAPVAVADTNSGLEDSTITGTVATNDSDVDDGATLTYAQTSAVAGLTINPDGSYSLDASNAAYQHLAQGATTDVVANYTVTDEQGASASSTLTITLTGTNDAPVAVADTNSGLEDATITGTVATNDSDVDDGASLSYSLDAQVAGLTLNPDGSYSLDASNAAYQHLAQGATTDVVANYTVTDEHGATASSILTITLTGSNDAPVAVADTNSGLEDATITGTVATNDSDVDDGASLSYSLDAQVAGLTLNPDGSYSLDASNAAYQHLAQDATTDVVASYTVTDEHGATASSILTITLTGSNDAPVAVADTNSGLEDSTITGTVATNDSDVDDGATLTYAQTSAVAGLTINPDGSYSLDASNAAYQHLAQGATTDVVANYTVTDEQGASASSTLTITLTGTNDAPVAVADTNSGLEDATITGTVATNDSDVDDGASLSYSLDAQVAGLTLNPDGSYSLDASNAAYQHLAQGATTDVVANYTVTDEHGATASSILTITLTGSNDAPVAVADTNSGLEDATITGTVATNDSDVDDGASLSYSLDAQVAGLTLNPDGSYSLDASNAAYQHLAQDATTDVVASYTVTDEHGATASSILTITLTGSNDAPVAVADTNSGLEDSTITGTVATNDSDVDDGATLTYAQTSAVAGLTINPDGSYSLDASNAAYQHLAQGATTDVVANYTVTDEQGASASSTLTITLTGTNDAPVAVADTNSGLEDATITGTVATNDSDVDDGASLSYSLDAQVAGLTLNPDGSYSLDASNAAYQHLAQGATTDVVANYTVTDEQGASASSTLTITLTGSNDAPVAVADTNSGLEDSTITGTVATNDSDVDDGATLSYSLDAPVAGLTINPDGSYSLDAANAAYQHLAQGATTDVVANYTVTDEHGASASSTLTITAIGTNDAPTTDLDANNSTTSGSNYVATFTDTGSPIAIADSDVSIIDPDNANMASAVVTLTNAKAGDVLAINGSLPGGITSTIDTSTSGVITVTLSGSASKAAYDAALNQIVFSTSVNPDTTDRHITVVVNDGLANSNTAISTIHVVDATAPSPPVITGFTTDSGTVGDHITNDTSLTIDGTAEANSTVTVFRDSVSQGTTTANGAGVWHFVDTTTLSNATTYQYSATATDASANTSVASANYAATIDTTAAAPVITGFTTDSGTVGDHITNDITLTINGTAEANATVTVFQDGVSIGTATADGSGNWSKADANVLANGTTYQFTANQTDVAGNTSLASASYAATIDTTAAAPVITGFTTDSGTVGDHITNDTTLTINGTAEANATVTVFQDGMSIGTATADGSGNWSKADANVLANGTTYQFTANQTDVAGNTSVASASYAATIDTTAAAPVITGFTTDSGTVGDHITNDTTLTINGTAEANATVTVFQNGVPIGTAIADGSGNWSKADANVLANGTTYQFTATQTDVAGNTSVASASYAATIDTTAAAPVITGFTTDSGTVGDHITNDTTLTINGTAEANATVTVFQNGVPIGTAIADGSGNWSKADANVLANGTTYQFTATQTDVAGNTSVASASYAATIDTSAPAAPTGLDLAAVDDTGSSSTDNITKNTSGLTISGSGENDAAVTLFDDANNNGVVDAGESLGTATASGGTFTLDVSLVQGMHNVRAIQTDVAGNLSAASTTHTLDITVDTTNPTVTFPTATEQGSSRKFDVSGTDSDSLSGVQSVIVHDGSASGTIVLTATLGAGTWSGTTSMLLSGAHTLFAVATDFAGNTASATHAVTAPAGIAGNAINLGLTDPSPDRTGAITVTVAGGSSEWSLNEGINNSDGTRTVVTNDIAALAVTSPSTYTGALVLNVTETWINADGSVGYATVTDNVEAYAPGSPMFALSGDDNLTGSSGHDLFVFSQPIGHDVVYSFDVASDQIDLIGYPDFTGFADIQSHMTDDAAGNAVITLGDGPSITLSGVDALSLTASDFVFDQTPVTENAGHMVISDGAILPLSGIIDNIGAIELNSAGGGTELELIEHGVTLQGHGQVILSDDSDNVITGTVSDVTLTNVDNTITGAGHLGDGVMTLVNDGTIIATGANSLDIDTGTNAIINSGTLEATGAGGLSIHSDVVNTGVLWADGGNVSIDGNVSGNGSALISGTATLAFAHASAENTTFDTGATGTLILGDSFNFSGTVSGMTADDHIDLLDFNFANAPTLKYTANADSSGGILSISDGSHTANFALVGSFDPTGFQIEADKTTGTLVSYHDFHLV